MVPRKKASSINRIEVEPFENRKQCGYVNSTINRHKRRGVGTWDCVNLLKNQALLPPRSMVGQLTLDQHIGVRIPGGQPIFSAIPKDSRSEFFLLFVRPGADWCRLFLESNGKQQWTNRRLPRQNQ